MKCCSRSFVLRTAILVWVLLGTSSLASAEQSAAQDWASIIAAPCQRCVSADSYRNHDAPVPIPDHAIVYSFSGEFAHEVDWWLINLDTGEVTKRESTSTGTLKWKTETKHFLITDPNALADVRSSAAKLWQSKPLSGVFISPGAYEEDHIVSGRELVAFERQAPSDGYLVTAIDAALSTAQPVK